MVAECMLSTLARLAGSLADDVDGVSAIIVACNDGSAALSSLAQQHMQRFARRH